MLEVQIRVIPFSIKQLRSAYIRLFYGDVKSDVALLPHCPKLEVNYSDCNTASWART